MAMALLTIKKPYKNKVIKQEKTELIAMIPQGAWFDSQRSALRLRNAREDTHDHEAAAYR